jgi:predicted deacetylase
VVAQTCIAPHLAHRFSLFRLDHDAPDADYVVAVDERSPWPLASDAEVHDLLAKRVSRGYVVVFDRDGWMVLRRNQRR